MANNLQDKKFFYFGSDRVYYSGVPIGSTVAYTFLGFSGTNTGFGTHGNESSNRIMISSSGTSYVQWSYTESGTKPAGEVWGGNSATLDGVHKSGLWFRSNAASQAFQLWAW